MPSHVISAATHIVSWKNVEAPCCLSFRQFFSEFNGFHLILKMFGDRSGSLKEYTELELDFDITDCSSQCDFNCWNATDTKTRRYQTLVYGKIKSA